MSQPGTLFDALIDAVEEARTSPTTTEMDGAAVATETEMVIRELADDASDLLGGALLTSMYDMATEVRMASVCRLIDDALAPLSGIKSDILSVVRIPFYADAAAKIDQSIASAKQDVALIRSVPEGANAPLLPDYVAVIGYMERLVVALNTCAAYLRKKHASASSSTSTSAAAAAAAAISAGSGGAKGIRPPGVRKFGEANGIISGAIGTRHGNFVCAHGCRQTVFVPGERAILLSDGVTATKAVVHYAAPDQGFCDRQGGLPLLALRRGALVVKTVEISPPVLEKTQLLAMIARINVDQMLSDVHIGAILRDVVLLGAGRTMLFSMTFGAVVCHAVPRPRFAESAVTADIYMEWSGASLRKTIEQTSDVDGGIALCLLVGALAQVVHGLDIAWHDLHFVHYDLHTSNIRMKLLPDVFGSRPMVLVRRDGRTVTIPAAFHGDSCAKIIDYGRAHCNTAAVSTSAQTIPRSVLLSPAAIGVAGLWSVGIPSSHATELPASDNAYVASGFFSLATTAYIEALNQYGVRTDSPTNTKLDDATAHYRAIAAACDALFTVTDPSDPVLYFMAGSAAKSRDALWFITNVVRLMHNAPVRLFSACASVVLFTTTCENVSMYTLMDTAAPAPNWDWIASQLRTRAKADLAFVGPHDTSSSATLFASITDTLLRGATQIAATVGAARRPSSAPSGSGADSAPMSDSSRTEVVRAPESVQRADTSPTSGVRAPPDSGVPMSESAESDSSVGPWVSSNAVALLMHSLFKYVGGAAFVAIKYSVPDRCSAQRVACLDILSEHMVPTTSRHTVASSSLPAHGHVVGANEVVSPAAIALLPCDRQAVASAASKPKPKPKPSPKNVAVGAEHQQTKSGAGRGFVRVYVTTCAFGTCEEPAAEEFACRGCPSRLHYCSERHQIMHWLSGHLLCHP